MSQYTFVSNHPKPSENRTARWQTPLLTNKTTNEKQQKSDENRVRCELCPQHCILSLNQHGLCFGRQNINGVLKTLNYGRHTGLSIDPIEKKPLYHYFPDSRILSFGTIGCNLSCRFCQNYRTSQSRDFTQSPFFTSPEELAQIALHNHCPSVAFTYNEPTIWAEYVIDAAQKCREAGIKTVGVTNGMISSFAREEFYAAFDAVNIDLKGFSVDFYQRLTGGYFECVKETIIYVAQKTNVWLELTNLLIPGQNDDPSQIDEMTRWIADFVGTETPLHFSAFFPTYRLTDIPATPPETLFKAAKIAKENGIKFVYCGNINDEKSRSTACPECGNIVIRRGSFFKNQLIDHTIKTDIKQTYHAFCPNCGQGIAGKFY